MSSPSHGLRQRLRLGGMGKAALEQLWRQRDTQDGRRLLVCLAAIVAVTLLFAGVLVSLVQHAMGSELHSHIILIPFVSAYLLYRRLEQLPKSYSTWLPGVVTAAILGAGLVALGFLANFSANDRLSVFVGAYVATLMAIAFGLLGLRWVKAAVVPLFFLLFLIPLPDALVLAVEDLLARVSADVSASFIQWAGVPMYREGQVFHLPGVVLEVARECSGIRSTWVLLIFGLVAAFELLETGWRRLLLVAVVIPLGILRNATRIFVIAWLCTQISPQMIHSPVHNRGGPIFFALSLVPLFCLIWWLRRQERSEKLTAPDPQGSK